MSSVIVVSETNFEQEVMTSDLPVLVQFAASWSDACRKLAPVLNALSTEFEGKAKVVMVDAEQSPRLAQALRVQNVPTHLLFVGGRPVDMSQGPQSLETLREMLSKHLPKAAGALAAKEAEQLALAGRITFVDIRPAAAFAHAHISGAVSFPAEEVESRLAELAMLPLPAVLYCRTGKDAANLASKLAELGSPTAFLEGGVLAWEGEGHRLSRAR
ncbi:MAG: thioredoxin domain-containing protein [Polyangiaceae bacterium]|nr:thioredoxin domain-containing protein [Polyangiaceae bacterium]